MNEQEVFFRSLKNIKDYWVQSSIEKLESGTDPIMSEFEEEYRYLQTVLADDESKLAYKKILDEVIQGVIHSILVIFDGGDMVTDEYPIAVINQDTGKVINETTALHEEFFGYLIDNE